MVVASARKRPITLRTRPPRARDYPKTAQALRLRARRLGVIASLGEQAVTGVTATHLMNLALASLCDVLEVEFASVFERGASGDSLSLKAGMGWNPGLAGSAPLMLDGRGEADFVLRSEQPVVVPDYGRETRFAIYPILAEHGIVSGTSVIIRGRERPYGVLGVYGRRRRRFSPDETHLIAGVANILGMAIEHERAEARWRVGEDRMRATLESTADGILVVDDAGHVVATNQQFARMWHIPAALLADATDDNLLEYVLDQLSDAPAFLATVRERYAHREAGSFDVITFKDGRVFERYSKPQRIDDACTGRVWSFRDVTDRQRAREALQQAYDELERRVAERTAELQAAHREAEALSYSIAHDLRAPLRAISGYARILMEDLMPSMPDDARALLDRVGVNAERMGMLIDALLGFGRLARQPCVPVRVSLDEVVDDVLGWMRVEAGEHPPVIERGALGEVRADPALLRIAIAHLLSNAIKFTRGRNPARITIGRTTADGAVAYFVRDNGTGFDMRYADKLFGMFQRLHDGSPLEGSGIGLASVQQIVQRHGGRVWAHSRPGDGATFYFTLNA